MRESSFSGIKPTELAALSLFPNLPDPDLALVALGAVLPGVDKGIFFVGLLAVIMSTANSSSDPDAHMDRYRAPHQQPVSDLTPTGLAHDLGHFIRT